MSMTPGTPRALHALLSMRERELALAQHDGRQLAERQVRLARNVDQLTRLYRAVSINGRRANAYSFQNRADYKRALVQMIETQQAPMAQLARSQTVAAQAVRDAQRRREGVATLVTRHELAVKQARNKREQQAQVAQALEVWQRGVSSREAHGAVGDIGAIGEIAPRVCVDKACTAVAWVGKTHSASRTSPEPGALPCCK
ncbi:flagellar export protein FliJ [Pandoraea fibrosis]|nr:flagellar export protein FliJ [Pandoraea fibrosis]